MSGADLELGIEIAVLVFWIFTAINAYAAINLILYTFYPVRDDQPLDVATAVFLPWLYVTRRVIMWVERKIEKA